MSGKSFVVEVLTVATAIAVGYAPRAAAQVRGSIEGTVVDAVGAAVPGATVEVRDPAINLVRSTTTDGQGRFRVSELPPSAYDVRVELSGFQPSVQMGAVVAVGSTVRLTVRLTPAAFAEAVTVTAHPPPLDASQTSVVSVIDPERIEELPVRSRNYLEFALLAPGVVPAATSFSPGGASAAVAANGFSFGGLRPTSNTLTIDGVDNNDAYTGGGRTELSLELVREFQVVTQGWSAENGGAAGGAINVVTKSGANIVHGDTFLFAQNGALNAPPPIEETGGRKPSLQRYRAGLAVGGPIVKDRTFYYVAGEQEETRDQAASDIDASLAHAINAVQIARSGIRVTTGLFPTSLSETELSGSVNANLPSNQTLRARVSSTRNRDDGDAFNTGGLVDVSARGSRLTTDVSGSASWTAVLGSSATDELRGQVSSRSLTQPTDANGARGVIIAGLAEFGTPAIPFGAVDEKYQELGDTVVLARGRHLVRAGGEVRRVSTTSTMTEELAGLSIYPNLAAFVANAPDQVRQSFGQRSRSLDMIHSGLFAQDKWSATSSVTLDAGIRFDANTYPSSLGISQRLLSPRIGVAWTPVSRWVVRAGAGRFMDRIPLVAFDRVLSRDGASGWEEVSDRSALIPAPSIYTVKPGTWNTASIQASAGIEHELSNNMTASVTYLYVRGTDLPRTVNVNAIGLSGNRFNPSLTDIFELQPTASSTSHGLALHVNRRLSNEFEWAAAYTLSKSTDDASAFDEQPQDPGAAGLDGGPSRYDQRHRFVASALFDLPIGDEEDAAPGTTAGFVTRLFSHIEVAPILTIGSGTPANAITGIDTFRTDAFPLSARPAGWSRNALRLPATATLDLRVLKFFPLTAHGRLDLVVEAFNLLNRTNVTAIDPVFGTGIVPALFFARPIEASLPRHLQFSIDFEF